jgi:hypothetical protein
MKRSGMVAVAVGATLSAMAIGSASAAVPPWVVRCSVVSRSVIAATLALDLRSGRGVRVGPGGTSCAYFGPTKGSPLTVVEYQTRFGLSAAGFVRQYGSNPHAHRVTGIGNLVHAYSFTGPQPGQVSLSVLDIRTVFTIQAFSSLTRIEALAKKIAPLA